MIYFQRTLHHSLQANCLQYYIVPFSFLLYHVVVFDDLLVCFRSSMQKALCCDITGPNVRKESKDRLYMRSSSLSIYFMGIATFII